MKAEYGTNYVLIKHFYSDVVAEYIDSSWDWSTLVGAVRESTWKPQTVLGTTDGANNRVGILLNPTTTMKGNKVFLLAGSVDVHNESGGNWKEGRFELKLVVGDVAKPSAGEGPSKWIKWGEIKSPFNETTLAAHKVNLTKCLASGGAGVLMEDGTIVFSLMAESGNSVVYSMIIYSTDNGSTWSISTGVSPAKCLKPRITEWEGSLLMIVDCENGQRVYESRDMGTTWTGTIGKLSGVWAKPQPEDSKNLSLHVDALITATIGKKKVMLYTQRGYASGENKANPLYLWVTDNNRSFCVGPVAMEEAAVRWEFASSLLYSDGNLHLLQQRDSDKGGVISLSRLTEELSKIRSVLSTWAQKDVFFSSFSIPTAGLVAVLSDAASGDTWNDDYLCLNATVRNATKVKDGLKLTESDSGVIWPVNIPDGNVRHVFLSLNFTLVASVTIEVAPSNNTPLLGATLGDTKSPLTMGILYTADNKWETMFNDKTTESGTWESGKEYQAALMLQGKKASVYIDGQLLGEEEAPLTGETPLELAGFCFGACGMQNSPVTVKNVFLYNRPLNPTEMTAIKDRIPVLTRALEPQAGGVSQTIASVVSGPEKNSAAPAVPMTLDPHAVEEVREGGAAKRNTSRTEDVQFVVPEVSLNSAGSGLMPLLLLLLLGLWGFAAL
ncbi:hypothetical protein ECC02_013861 [Trypanosoma cruzi]|nr:hypothetical protein ECC02_013861 [Trypanosoma cruzi]